MASAAPNLRRNDPEPQPVIVKKIMPAPRQAHHGGQWKVAYADFVTAMMAFFMLLWLISTTDEDKRHGLADYFSPTLMEMKEDSAGSTGLLGGDTISESKFLHRAASGANAAISLPRPAANASLKGDPKAHVEDRWRFQQLRWILKQRMDSRAELRDLQAQVHLTETTEGLRIDLIDKADFSMFAIGTDQLVPKARDLVREVAAAIASLPNPVIVRGHTDSRPYAPRQVMNNWLLSTARAEATRSAMLEFGLAGGRVARIEGVADTQPCVANQPLDPRNRRISITLGWTGAPASACPEHCA
jgi:chemotaxis protein MotB